VKNLFVTISIKNVVPVFDPGNIMLLLMLWAVLGIPLSVLTVILFYAVRWLPFRLAQVLVPLGAGIIFIVVSMSMEPPVPGNSEALRFLIGIFIHPLLFLPPALILQKYLHRIPVMYAVFFTAFISMCILITLGAMQGDQLFVQLNGGEFLWKAMISVARDIITASGAFVLIIMLDIFLTGTEEENP
jgi:hypothetical protein